MVYTRPRHARAAVFASVVLCLIMVVVPTSVLARATTIVAPPAVNSSRRPDREYIPTSAGADDGETLFQPNSTERSPEEPLLEEPHWLPLLKRARRRKPPSGDAWSGDTTMRIIGNLGIGAMQAIQSSDDELLKVLDKAQNNPLMIDGHSAWGNFCAAGTFISNGDIISVGGQTSENTELGKPGVAGDGFTGLRVFRPTTRQFLDDPRKAHIQSARWYASVIRVTDGSALIMGGSKKGQYNNERKVDNPTMEFVPSKGSQYYSKFLHDALDSNMFPIAFLLSKSGHVFVMANEIAMIYDWKNNREYRVEGPPGGIVRTYPGSATAVLLPLTIKNRWLSEALICGGVFNTVNMTNPGHDVRADEPVSDQCVRTSFPGGTRISGWHVEHMPSPRIMGDPVLTPDGKLLIVGGAQKGTAGYGNAIGMGEYAPAVGHSNAKEPNLTPVLYNPDAPRGQRFSNKFPAARIERMYHSAYLCTSEGNILAMGSSPNPRVLTKIDYKTRFEIESIAPPYMSKTRPAILSYPGQLNYTGRYTLTISNPMGCDNARVVLLDGGYATHGLHMNQRLVELPVTSFTNQSRITFRGPPDPTIWPPGPAFLWLTVCEGNIPSKGHKIMVGDGSSELNLLLDPPNYKVPF
ncbi:BZ3500_MvSof-1268-A1-R1_Chr7-2g09487 [Microbotryum saponariae]|uniref:BZ3500_MvSof-1268-A1-R1_Chr7-2g09487 protein n=1 Tax=Microbotryum saponariae TaxID=289078 RepID=A0A2X0N5T0_9BASI|nr:BZ3501_MvSof-1269-A2-R1_Chr7-1g09187 [Microbotryum saponariae]SDA02542.1 BZ3500_MvSof-1268-A1-R1_Chr7-2g09487 [Microbotryum saponariae]